MSDYWKDRMQNSLNRVSNKSINAIDRQLKKYYKTAMQRTIEDFENTYNKLLATMEEGREPTPADLYKLDKYWKMQSQLQNELQKLGDKQVKALGKIFELNYFDVYYSFAKESLPTYSRANVEIARQAINQIWCADGKSWSQRVWENTALLQETLNEKLVECVVTGRKASELKKTLMERFNVSFNQADTLARTEIAHIQTQSAKQRYKDSGVKRVQVWADYDERRCDECGKLHEKYFSIYDNVPIPKHPRCRCCIVPVVED